MIVADAAVGVVVMVLPVIVNVIDRLNEHTIHYNTYMGERDCFLKDDTGI